MTACKTWIFNWGSASFCVSSRRGLTSWLDSQRQWVCRDVHTRKRDQTEQFFLFLLSTFFNFSKPAFSATNMSVLLLGLVFFVLPSEELIPKGSYGVLQETSPCSLCKEKFCILLTQATQPRSLQQDVRVLRMGEKSSPKTFLWFVHPYFWFHIIRKVTSINLFFFA